MTTYNQNVAQNVCGELPVTIPVNIDCSLCAIGFPQAGGMIGINFFGPRCIAGADPSPSYWLGFNTKMAQWKCPNPGQDAEPEPNTWVATGFFGGASSGGCSNQYRFDATLVALNSSQISISVSVKVLAQTAGVWSWQSYMSWSETLTEIVNADTTRYRGRAFASPDFISVTPSSVGGTGDLYYRGKDAEGNPVPVPVTELANSGFLSQLQGLILLYDKHYSILKDEWSDKIDNLDCKIVSYTKEQLNQYCLDYGVSQEFIDRFVNFKAIYFILHGHYMKKNNIANYYLIYDDDIVFADDITEFKECLLEEIPCLRSAPS